MSFLNPLRAPSQRTIPGQPFQVVLDREVVTHHRTSECAAETAALVPGSTVRYRAA